MTLPPSVVAGSAFAIPTSGSGSAELFIVGSGQSLRREVQLGEPVLFAVGTLKNAGIYSVILTGSSPQSGLLAVTPGPAPKSVAFLAEPSRLPVGLSNAVSGVVYLFDGWRNLIVAPTSVSFTLSGSSGPPQTRATTAHDGVAWVEMDSAPQAGKAEFVARAGDASNRRVIQEVPGDPCNLSVTATPKGNMLEVGTAPVRDCSGNPVSDGTIVTFTESYNGMQTTADVPLKKDVASIAMPAHPGATISVASGVVAGNQIHWSRP
ncbi:MAG: hypothetical protein WCC27_18780 [Acidobacteriaceae bacterium]